MSFFRNVSPRAGEASLPSDCAGASALFSSSTGRGCRRAAGTPASPPATESGSRWRSRSALRPRAAHSQGQQCERARRRPDEAAAEAGAGHAAPDVVGQRHKAVQAHPGQEEDAAAHVDLLEQVHEGAEAGVVVVVAPLQVEHLDQRVGHQNQVRPGQVHKVQVGGCQVAPSVQVDHEDEDVPNEANRKQGYGVEPREDEADDVVLRVL